MKPARMWYYLALLRVWCVVLCCVVLCCVVLCRLNNYYLM